MIDRTTIGTIFSSSNSVEILIHIHENPGCRMSEIYRNVTRNAHTKEKVLFLADTGHFRLAGFPSAGCIAGCSGRRKFDNYPLF